MCAFLLPYLSPICLLTLAPLMAERILFSLATPRSAYSSLLFNLFHTTSKVIRVVCQTTHRGLAYLSYTFVARDVGDVVFGC